MLRIEQIDTLAMCDKLIVVNIFPHLEWALESWQLAEKGLGHIALRFILFTMHLQFFSQQFWCVVGGIYRVSQKTCPAFERLLLPGHISSDILQYLIE